MFQSAGLYYQANCGELQKRVKLKQPPLLAFKADRLIKDKFLADKRYLKNLLMPADAKKKNEFSFGILLPTTIAYPKPYQLYVRGTFSNAAQLKMYQDLINEGVIDQAKKTITWVELPGHSLRDFSSGLWQMRAALQRFKQSQEKSTTCPAFADTA